MQSFILIGFAVLCLGLFKIQLRSMNMRLYNKVLQARQKHIEMLAGKTQDCENTEDAQVIFDDYLVSNRSDLEPLFDALLESNEKIQEELKSRSDGKFTDNNDREYTPAEWIKLQTDGVMDNVLWQVSNMIKNRSAASA